MYIMNAKTNETFKVSVPTLQRLREEFPLAGFYSVNAKTFKMTDRDINLKGVRAIEEILEPTDIVIKRSGNGVTLIVTKEGGANV
jgi:hypothetical protein